jgi:hypothetical protein
MTNTDEFNVAERIREIGSILASGVLRLHPRTGPTVEVWPENANKNLPDSCQDSLELPDKTVLSVHTG